MAKEFSSKFLEDAVREFSKLPGIGGKTALRLVLHLLKQPPEDLRNFGTVFLRLQENINYCRTCYNISDSHHCEICSNTLRDETILCVVADIRDVMAIESTAQYKGLYHVLGGIISPMDGIGPQDLTVDKLEQRIDNGNVKEIIMALSTTMEGEMTNHYIFKRLQHKSIEISTIAKGIAIGDSIEYADEVTLGQSILNRTPYEQVTKRH